MKKSLILVILFYFNLLYAQTELSKSEKESKADESNYGRENYIQKETVD